MALDCAGERVGNKTYRSNECYNWAHQSASFHIFGEWLGASGSISEFVWHSVADVIAWHCNFPGFVVWWGMSELEFAWECKGCKLKTCVWSHCCLNFQEAQHRAVCYSQGIVSEMAWIQRSFGPLADQCPERLGLYLELHHEGNLSDAFPLRVPERGKFINFLLSLRLMGPWH